MSSKERRGLRRQGTLFVVSAPSGAGKTSLCRALVARLPDVRYSVSCTTRKPRQSEAEAHDYHFVDEARFKAMIAERAFLEWAEVYGNFYGTPMAPIRAWIAQGVDVLLDIDQEGARQIRQQEPEAVSLYILPPSLETLRRRLEDRKGDSPGEIARRLHNLKKEIKQYHEFRHIIINDDFNYSSHQFEAIVLAERTRTATLDLSGLEADLLRNEEGN